MEDASFIEKSVNQENHFFVIFPPPFLTLRCMPPKSCMKNGRKVYSQFDGRIGKYGAGPGEPCPDVKNPIAGYAAMMENFDNQIGQLLDLVTKLGVDDNLRSFLAVTMVLIGRADMILISGIPMARCVESSVICTRVESMLPFLPAGLG